MKCFDFKNGFSLDDIKEISLIIKNDGIVVFPTETVYGIAASALSKKAIDKVYKAKKRPLDKAINIMVSSKDDIEKYAYIRNDIERKIIDNFMPGPVTLILDKKEGFGKGFTKIDTVGVRIPDNDIALSILKEVDLPIIAPSANISGKPSGVDPEEIKRDFSHSVDAIIDAGVINNGIASTIVRVDDGKINILRDGVIAKEMIEKIVR